MSIVTSSTVERRVFTAADGRILGNEVRLDTWFEPFAKTGETSVTQTVVGTAGPFFDMAEAGRWVDELHCAQDVARTQAFISR
jgi:hypothetical protein